MVTIPPDGPRKDAEMTVTLRPCATIKGRLVDGEGKPASGGVRVELVRQVGRPRSGTFSRPWRSSTPRGGSRCDDLPAGGPYQISAANRTGLRFRPTHGAGNIQAVRAREGPDSSSPGSQLDFGTVDVNTGKRVGDAPAAKARHADVPITGRIVNLEGQPIAGVSVKVDRVLVPKADDLTPWLEGVKKGEPPWIAYRHIDGDRKAPRQATREATTDKDGRFRLEGFGADRVVGLELQGGPIAYHDDRRRHPEDRPDPGRGFREQPRPGEANDLRGRLHLHRDPQPADRRGRERRQDRPAARRCRDSELPVRRLGFCRHHELEDQD